MSKKQRYLNQIQQQTLPFAIEKAVFNQEGQYNDVLIVNDSYVFRFAKVQAAIQTLRQEIELLQRLQNQLPLAIPNPIFHNIQTNTVGEAFMGYPLIKGIPLWRDTYHAITDSQIIDHIAHQLAQFLACLHSIDVERSFPEKLPQDEGYPKWATLYTQIETKLFDYMRPDARQQVTKHFDRYLNAPKPYHPTLRHGDFGTGNIIYAPTTQSVRGIIDFSFTQLGDPATDFAAIYASFGETFYKQCCKTYPEMGNALERVQFYNGTFALQEALFGIENDDKVAFQAGIADYC